MTRVLFFGDMAPSGFGTVTMDIGRRLLEQGIDVRFISQNELGDLPEPFGSRTVNLSTLLTSLNPVTGLIDGSMVADADVISGLLQGRTPALLYDNQPWGEWRPEACIIVADFTAARMIVARAKEAFADLPTFHYVPIEGVGLPPGWNDVWSLVTPVAMSKFGADEIAKITGQRPPVIYHGVETDVFHAASRQQPITLTSPDRPDVKLVSRDECKAMWAAWFGVPMAKKWILRTDRHMPRKRYNSMIRALAPLLAQRPEVALVLHCAAFDQGGYLPDTISKIPGAHALNEPTDEHSQQGWALFGREHAQILLSDTRGLPRPALVSLYNAADLYVSTSAEGFGLTIAEAIACGVPAVAMDYSAVPEVVGPAGICVPTAYLVENEYDHLWAAIDEAEFAQKVEFLITHQTKREALGRKGPAHIAANFRWDVAAQRFASLVHDVVVTRQAA